MRQNSPMLAYEAIYGKPLEEWRPGQDPSHEKKLYQNMLIDKLLEPSALNELQKIPNIEVLLPISNIFSVWQWKMILLTDLDYKIFYQSLMLGC